MVTPDVDAKQEGAGQNTTGIQNSVDVPTRKRKIRTPDGAMETEVTPSFVPASSLIASDSKNYPQQFQPRDREQSVSSKAQIENAASNLDPGTLLQDSRGSETGAPKVLPNGVVLSGNGRTMMIRRAHEKKLGAAYDEAVRKKAADMGVELPELKNGDYWVYVEKVDMPEGEAVKFAESSNRNTILQRSAYEQAEADAKSIAEDKEFLGIIGHTENDGSVSVRDSSYFPAVQRFAYVIHAGDEGLLDSRGTPTAAVYDRLENALIASLFRNLPQDEARSAIRSIIERDTTGKGEGMARAFNGVIRAVPSLLSMANSAQGRAGRDITDKVGKALVRYIGMRKSGMKNSEIQAMAEKAQPLPGFGQLGIEDTILAQLAFRAGKNYPVGDFLVEYASGAMNALTERDMFGQDPPTNETLMANAIRRADEKRESNGAVLGSPLKKQGIGRGFPEGKPVSKNMKKRRVLSRKLSKMLKKAGVNVKLVDGQSMKMLHERSTDEKLSVGELAITQLDDSAKDVKPYSNEADMEKDKNLHNRIQDGVDPKSEKALGILYDQAKENAPILESLTNAIKKEIHGSEAKTREPVKAKKGETPDPYAEGHPVKKSDRVREKAGSDYGNDYTRVVDLIGSTVVLPDDTTYKNFFDALEKVLTSYNGVRVAKIKPFLLTNQEPSYRDVKVSLRFPNGGIGEIIVASKFYDKAKFKLGGHVAYEITRTIKAKWPNVEGAPQEFKDVYDKYTNFSKLVYSRGTSFEDLRTAYALASSSLTRLLESQLSTIGSEYTDVAGKLKSISSEFHSNNPYSLNSYATPKRSLIKNINNTSKGESSDNESVSKSGNNVKDDASAVSDFQLSGQPVQTDLFDSIQAPGGLNAFAKKNGLSKERKAEMKADVAAFNKALRDKTFSAFFDALRDGNPEQAKLLQDAFRASADGNTVSRILYDYFKARNTGVEHLKGKRVASAEDMAALFMTLRSPFVESFKVAFLDKDNRVLDIRVTSVGDIASAPASIVSTMGEIPEGAVSYIISHNHPSGDPDPSDPDKGVTSRFRTYAKEAFGLEMLDHIITNGKSFYSFQRGEIINFTTPYKESWEASDGTIKLDAVTKTEAFINGNLRNGRDGEYIHVIYLNHHVKINAIRRIPVSKITKDGYILSDALKSEVFKDVGKFGTAYLMIDACGLYGHEITAEMASVSETAKNIGLRVLDVVYKDEFSDFNSAARSARSMLAESGQKYLTTADGIVYGGVQEDGEIYLNEDGLDPDAMISEYTRLWAETVKKNEPVLWEQGKHIFKKSALWNQVKQETGLQTDDDIASEVLARLSGKNGSALIEEMMESGKNPGKKEVEYLRNFWTNVKNQFMPWSKNENPEIDIRAFSLMPVADLVAGRNPMSDLSDRQFKIATSEKFIREHGNWMEDPESADIELDEHGEPVLDGNGTPLPRLANTPKVEANVGTGKDGLPNTLRVESKGTEAHGTAVTRESIIQLVHELFPEVAIQGPATHSMRGAAGWWEIGKGMIRLKNRAYTAVLMHELGHAVDEFYKVGAKTSTKSNDSLKIPTIVREQLVGVGKGLYGDKRPTGGYASEGWAEFIKHYILSNDESLRQQCPDLFDWFLHAWAPANKEVFAKFEKIRNAVADFHAQTPEETVRAFWNGKLPFSTRFLEWRERHGATKSGIIHSLIDSKHFLYEQMKKAGVLVDYFDKNLSPKAVAMAIKNDPYLKATLYQGASSAKTVQAVLEYTTDLSGVKRTGKSLQEALSLVRGKDKEFLNRFIDYAVARQALIYNSKGLESGLTEREARSVVEKLQCQEYEETLKEVTDWSRRVLHLLVEGGVMTEEEFARIENDNPIYIKFLRNFRGELKTRGMSSGSGRPVHRRKGSVRDIEHPIAAMILDVQKIIEAAQRADLARCCALVAMRTKQGSSLGQEWMVDVPTPKEACLSHPDELLFGLATRSSLIGTFTCLP